MAGDPFATPESNTPDLEFDMTGVNAAQLGEYLTAGKYLAQLESWTTSRSANKGTPQVDWLWVAVNYSANGDSVGKSAKYQTWYSDNEKAKEFLRGYLETIGATFVKDKNNNEVASTKGVKGALGLITVVADPYTAADGAEKVFHKIARVDPVPAEIREAYLRENNVTPSTVKK